MEMLQEIFEIDLGPIQDTFRFRAKQIGLKLAELLIDEKGDLAPHRLDELISHFSLYPFFPKAENETLIYSYVKKCLELLKSEPKIWGAIKKFSPPLCHKGAEELIRNTLLPDTFRSLQTVHVRRAVMAAWLTLLRQATGSCFATAPAILIQKQCPTQMFKDLYDLLSTGQLKRVVGGKEYVVPLNLIFSKGDLERVSPWLHFSLGVKLTLEKVGLTFNLKKIKEMGPTSPDLLFKTLLLEELGLTNEDLEQEELFSKIEIIPQTAVYYQKPSERALKVSEWKKKVQAASLAFISLTECFLLRSWEYTIASLCDVKTEFARWNLFIGLGMHPDLKNGIGSFLYSYLNERFQKYQKEMEELKVEYDEELRAIQALEAMAETASDMHRNQLKAEWVSRNLSANSILERKDEFEQKIKAVHDFFPFLMEQIDLKLQDAFQELFDPALKGDKVHLYDDSPAGFRLVYKHGRKDASQWSSIYTVDQYVQVFRDFFSGLEREIAIDEAMGDRFVTELFTDLILFLQTDEFLNGAIKRAKEAGRSSPWDYFSGGTMQTLLQAYTQRDFPFKEIRVIPKSAKELFDFYSQFKQEGPLLTHSPTHAFIFYPECSEKVKLLKNGQELFDERMQEHFIHKISEKIPEEKRALFIHLARKKGDAKTNLEFRSHLIESLGGEVEIIDSVFFEETPLFSEEEANEILKKLTRNRYKKMEGSFFGPLQIFEWAKRCIGKGFSKIDVDLELVHELKGLGVLQRGESIFADPNWSGWFLGWVINPVTEELELWRLNRLGLQGFPMTDWKEWYSESNTAPWILLPNPKEYTP